MKFLAAVTILLSCSGAFGDTFYSCSWIDSPDVNCDLFTPSPTCGTDLVTYANKCEFSKAHCADDTLNLLSNGTCATTPMSTQSPVAGSDVVLDFMCTSLSHLECPKGGEKVCADDGWTYENACEYEKGKCTHRDLHVVDCTA